MIFITLGSQKFQFDRLLKAVDDLVERSVITEPVFAQIGYSTYTPKHYEYKKFLDRDEFASIEGKADIIITHAGTGAIVGAVKQNKKVIAVPRLSKYGEHVDDHQLQIVAQFKKMNLICVCEDLSKLDEALEYTRKTSFEKYKSNTHRIIDNIDKYITDCFGI